MNISIRFFATLKDRAGTGSAQLDIPEPATVADLLKQLVERFPALEPSMASVLVAVNQEYRFPGDPIHPGDEVALFPPVSGGSGSDEFPEYFAVTPDRLNFDAILSTITRPETGAVCVFTGAVRGATTTGEQVRTTEHLEYEAYAPMAEKTLRQVAAEIRQQYPNVQGIAIVQRIGTLQVGETTIFVACAAGHRNDGCFEGARYGIDRVKQIVPVWKKEVGPDAELWVEGGYRPTPGDINVTTRGAAQDEPDPVSATQDATDFVIGCPACGMTYPLVDPPLRCTCGSPLEVTQSPAFDPEQIDQGNSSLWRYRRFLLPPGITPVTIGEGWTPLVSAEAFGRTVHLKLECINPTGAFKDRGASTLVSLLVSQGVTAVHDDSSGNAGAALAAYATRAGVHARLYVPESASPVKLGQIRLYGAELVAVPGPRTEARRASEQAVYSGSYYASHIDHPFAVFAYKSLAFELWEQTGQRGPDAVVLPLGHGSLILGLAWGFGDLHRAGLLDRLPGLYGVQARACAPLMQALHPSDTAVGDGETLAEGIRIADPVRRERVIEVVRASGGDILAVKESDILTGISEFARRGLAVEPTSAIVWSGLAEVTRRLPQRALIAICVTGSGLKYPGLDRLILGDAAHENAAPAHPPAVKG